MITYPYYVVLALPSDARDEGNQLIKDTTENPADIQSFRSKAFKDDGSQWYWCSLPMTQINFDRLPSLQTTLGGDFEVIREVTPEGEIVVHDTARGWLESIDLTLPDDPEI